MRSDSLSWWADSTGHAIEAKSITEFILTPDSKPPIAVGLLLVMVCLFWRKK